MSKRVTGWALILTATSKGPKKPRCHSRASLLQRDSSRKQMQILFRWARTAKVIVLRKHMMSMMCAAGILCSGGGALAQTIYKQIDATGRVMFTDRPAAGIVEPYATLPNYEGGSVSPPRSANGVWSDVAKALFSNSAMTSMNAATIDFNEATRRLLQARQNRQEGMEPRPGEQADSAGVSAMNKRYQRRQQKLEREVVAAELRSQETALVRSALSRSDGKTAPIRLAQP